jgi:penicillin-insensitive murein DD-endopeptidase
MARELRRACNATIATIALIVVSPSSAYSASQCFGTVSNGRINASVKLPINGPNFSAYSQLGHSMGRTYVHSEVASVVVSTYDQLSKQLPQTVFVYGETGWASGGSFRPHRSHQNGLSVDFFVPVRNAKNESVPLPTNVSSRYGYDIEFNSKAQYEQYSIDFHSIAEHLFQLHQAAKARNFEIAQVIFDRVFLPKLLATPRGPYLRKHLHFMKAKPWIRHDEHYHVDFALPCRPKVN